MAIYTDINSLYKVLAEVDNILVFDEQAIIIGLINTLNTMVDQDGISERPFRPNFPNTNFTKLLNEPIDIMTAFQVNMALESILVNNPRAAYDPQNTSVVPNINAGGFDITIGLIDKISSRRVNFSFIYNSVITV